MQLQEFARHSINGRGVSVRSASLDCIGQGPLRWSCPTSPERIDFLRVTRPYGRFGNNLIQAMNAYVIAKNLAIKNLQLCNLSETVACEVEIDGVNVSFAPVIGDALEGCFYAPYGFESLFECSGVALMGSWQKALSTSIYAHLLSECPPPAERLAIHFRSGDIFATSGPVSSSYVQPPFAYYKLAIGDALASRNFERIDLVYEDKANPSIELTENVLTACGVPYVTQASTLQEDLVRMLSATCIISSVSTLCEAVALTSSRVKRYYSFREHSSQSEFSPFFQTQTAAILKSRHVECRLIDDMTRHYTAKWQWQNSEAQRKCIRDFPVESLRLYEG